MRENADQSNSEYGHFILSVHFVCSKKCCVLPTITCLVQTTAGFHSNLNCFKPIYSRLPPIYSSLPPGVNPKTVACCKNPKIHRETTSDGDIRKRSLKMSTYYNEKRVVLKSTYNE